MHDSPEQIAEKQRILGELESRLKALDRIKRELTAQAQILRHQLQELHKSGPQHGSIGQERRTTPRRQGNLVPVTITIAMSQGSEADAPAIHGWVLNRSGGGLCLLVDEEVVPGAV